MRALAFFAVLLCSASAPGADSAWLLCQGSTSLFGKKSSLVVNSFEHRSGADKRQNDFVLIFGGYALRGSAGDSAGGGVTLKDGELAKLSGNISVDYQKPVLRVKGTLITGSAKTNVDAELSCTEMN
jgi:hypothetical protein